MSIYSTPSTFISSTQPAMAAIPLLVVRFLLLPWLLAQAQTTFFFPTLKGLPPSNLSTLDFVGKAVINPNFGICLTNESEYISGAVFYSEPVRFKDPGSKDVNVSFSTTFVFTMIPSSTESGDGLAFIIMPSKSLHGVLPGRFFGLLNLTTVGQPYNHLFAVEFDTARNFEFLDIDSNHVGVDLNDVTSVESQSAGYWVGNQFQELDLNNKQNIQAWIDYDHLQKEVKVTIAPAGSVRPTKPLISKKNMNLSTILEEEMYVGFSAATGLYVEDHYILAWSFSTNGTAPALNTSIIPYFVETKSKTSKWRVIAGSSSAFAVILLLVAAALVWVRRKKHRSLIEKWEMEYWPHRFSYRDLHIATKGFAEERLLGCGGFGKVYKGVLSSNGLEVAVKCILKDTSEAVKEFVAEISSLGRLKHRNLLQIRGYGRRGTQLFIVYDYMPNGSVDKMLFGNPDKLLTWAQRYIILKDAAAGLLYLHQEWEQRVVHRDIKSSNVLVDSELHGKLGDFGLARLYGHDESSLTTRVVGTPGYIAPELVHTGKATPTTDVFSFGVLMLEVACGRSPLNPFVDDANIVLLDWVRDLHGKGRLMDAADPRLGSDYVEDEMERVLNLGVLCSNPQPEGRPDMREVVQILEGQASINPGDQLEFPLPLSHPLDISTLSSIGKSSDASISHSLETR